MPEAEQEAVATRPAPIGLSCLALQLLFEFFSTGLEEVEEVKGSLKGGYGGNPWKPGSLSQRGGECQGSELGLLGELPHPIQRPARRSERPQSPVQTLPIIISSAQVGSWIMDQTSTSPFFH